MLAGARTVARVGRAARVPSSRDGRNHRTAGPRRKDRKQAKRRGRGELSRTIAILVLALAVILFAVKNLNQVKVNWVVGSGRAPLIIVILITLLVGIVISHLAGRLSRRKRRRTGASEPGPAGWWPTRGRRRRP